MTQLAKIEDRDLAKRCGQIVVVVNQDMQQARYGQSKIVQRSREARPQLVIGNVVTALRYAHGDTLCRLRRIGESNVTQHHDVPASRRFFKKRYLVADRIGKDGLEDKTLAALQELATQSIGQARRDSPYSCPNGSRGNAARRRGPDLIGSAAPFRHEPLPAG